MATTNFNKYMIGHSSRKRIKFGGRGLGGYPTHANVNTLIYTHVCIEHYH